MSVKKATIYVTDHYLFRQKLPHNETCWVLHAKNKKKNKNQRSKSREQNFGRLSKMLSKTYIYIYKFYWASWIIFQSFVLETLTVGSCFFFCFLHAKPSRFHYGVIFVWKDNGLLHKWLLSLLTFMLAGSTSANSQWHILVFQNTWSDFFPPTKWFLLCRNQNVIAWFQFLIISEVNQMCKASCITLQVIELDGLYCC